MQKNIFKKIILTSLIFLVIFNTVSLKITQAQAENSVDQTFTGLSNLSSSKQGIIPCNAFVENRLEGCNPADAAHLLMTLVKIAMYVIVLGLFVFLIIGALGYVYYGQSPSYLNKWKKYLKNSVYALLILIFGVGLLFGLLAALGFQKNILDFIKQLLATQNWQLFTHSYAQDISSLVDSSSTGTTTQYVNFFPGQSFWGTILNGVKFLISYLVAPILVLFTIWAGVLFVAAQGNIEKLVKAKKFALRVAIGIAVTAAAYPLISTVLNTLNDVVSKTS